MRDSNYPIERWLHGILDAFLRYNLIYIRTALTLGSVYSYRNIVTIFNELAKGIPYYLYPNIDTVMYAIIEEILPKPWEDLRIDTSLAFSETVNYPGALFYDGTEYYSGFISYDIPGALAAREEAPVTCRYAVTEHARQSGDLEGYASNFFDGSIYYDYSELYLGDSRSVVDDEFILNIIYA